MLPAVLLTISLNQNLKKESETGLTASRRLLVILQKQAGGKKDPPYYIVAG